MPVHLRQQKVDEKSHAASTPVADVKKYLFGCFSSRRASG